jgi:hypothetical protein
MDTLTSDVRGIGVVVTMAIIFAIVILHIWALDSVVG